MRAVTIWDKESLPGGGHILSFDLVDLLALLENDLAESVWTVVDVEEVIGVSAPAFYEAHETGQKLSGSALLQLAERCDQVCGGNFRGELDGEFWVRLLACRSTEWAVVSEDSALFDRIEGRFSDVRPSPEDAIQNGA